MSRSRKDSIARPVTCWLIIFILAVFVTACGGGSSKDTASASINDPGSTSTRTDTKPPSVSLAADKVSIAETGIVTLEAAASDESGIEKVDFIENDVVIETVKAPPFVSKRTYTMNDNGSKHLIAKAYDKAGNVASSAVIDVIVNIPSSTWSVTDLGSLGGGDSHASAINDAGEIVGNSAIVKSLQGERPQTHAFLYKDGKMIDLGTLEGYNYSRAHSINNAGQVVGSVVTEAYWSSGFLYQNGQMTPIDTCTKRNVRNDPYFDHRGYALTINDAGEIGGWFGWIIPATGADLSCTFISGDGTPKDLFLGTTSIFTVEVMGINNAGQAIGYGFDGNISAMGSYLFDKGDVTRIGPLDKTSVPEGRSTWAQAINSHGQVVGKSADSAFLYSNGTLTDLGAILVAARSIATGINDKGQIVGLAYPHSQGRLYPFLYSNGTVINLNELPEAKSSGWTITGVIRRDNSFWSYDLGALKINNKGQIIADAVNALGVTHAILLTPLEQ